MGEQYDPLPEDEGATGLMRFLDVRALAVVFAFIFVMWLVTGLEENEVPARRQVAEACIHILLWQAGAFFVGGIVGEWLPKVALVFFCLTLAAGLMRLSLLPGPWLYGPDLVLLFNGVMAWGVYKTAGRYLSRSA